MEKFTPQLPDEPAHVPPSTEKDLVNEAEVRNLLVQHTPAALKDIALIEQGVANFLSFHDAPEALTHLDRLNFLNAKDLRWLETKDAVRLCHYLRTTADGSRLEVQTVAVRPRDMSGAMIGRIKRACVRESAYAIIRHLAYRERVLGQLEERGELAVFLRKRLLGEHAAVPMRKFHETLIRKLPEMFRNLSFEHFLKSEIEIPDETRSRILLLLSARPAGGSLEHDVTPPEDIERLVLERGGRPVLVRLSQDVHIVCPVLSPSGTALRGELDHVSELYAEAARAVLIQAAGHDPARVTYATLAELHRLLSAHASFQNESHWPRCAAFINETGELALFEDQFAAARREQAVKLVLERLTKQLNMRFDPLLFEAQSAVVSLPDQLRALFPDTAVAAGVLIAQLRANPEIVTFQDRRGPGAEDRVYVLYKANLPGAFIRHKDKRSFYHLLAKENGFSGGIYSFLTQDTAGPLAEESAKLAAAVREWEAEQEAERLRRERESLGFFARILDWFLALFGLSKYSRRISDRSARSHGSDSVRAIPARLKKVVDYVERNNRGLIWMDELLRYLKNQYSPDDVAKILDQGPAGIYREVEKLAGKRRLFLRNENLASAEWRQTTLDRLESRFSPGPEIRILIDYVREFGGD